MQPPEQQGALAASSVSSHGPEERKLLDFVFASSGPGSRWGFIWAPFSQPRGAPGRSDRRPPKAPAMESSPGRPFPPGTRKTWLLVSAVELVIILILAAGLAHLATHLEEGDEEERCPPEGGKLASLRSMNETLREATTQWEACQSYTRVLRANISSLETEMTELSMRLRMKEFENNVLEDKLALLKNLTHHLRDLHNQQKDMILHLQQQHRKLSSGNSLHNSLPLFALVVAGVLLV